jgi:hypothetical protein
MKLMVGGFLILVSLLCLSACALIHSVGPCDGYGCPSYGSSSSDSSQSAKSAALSKLPAAKTNIAKPDGAETQDAKTQAKTQPPADAQSKQGN